MRLQLGVSVDCLTHESQRPFINKRFVHLGNPNLPTLGEFAEAWKTTARGRVSYFFDKVLGGGRLRAGHSNLFRSVRAVAPKTNFVKFYYRKGDFLPFGDASISFIFSEHFFEHLFLDEAGGLIKECFRCLKRGGVMRTVVPDADLRVHEPIEPAGFSAAGPSWNDPQKHKIRWNVYGLTYMLRIAEFRPVPLEYCDRDGNYFTAAQTFSISEYEGCIDSDLIRNFGYCKRLPGSLCVDAIKE